MQRRRVLVTLATSLYWGIAALTTDGVRAQTPAAPEAPPAAPPEPAAPAAPPPPAEQEKPHIAALLPTKSATFGKLADAVRRGLIAGASVSGPSALPLIVYPTGDDTKELVDTYDHAIRVGARLVIGPLTKAGVHAIAGSNAVTVPTLALTIPDSDVLLPDGMYAFGVQIESEARQMVKYALSQGRRRAVIIASDNSLGRRVATAFAEDWTRSGRLVVDQYMYTTDQVALKKIKDGITIGNADMIFLALDAPRARSIRPYLGKILPTYGTSQVFMGGGEVVGQHDLNGVTFVDMPWLLMPDHPAVITYPRTQGIFASYEQERFYALGIDAWRLGQVLLESGFNDAGTLDGVTGYLTPGGGRQFTREAIGAQFVQGQPKLLNPVSGR
ncbi:MAG: penicillin-binding protein activator [Burkholderiales bacterium]|nr:penicillin-binding protein activator [Burkholderiales bacterium]